MVQSPENHLGTLGSFSLPCIQKEQLLIDMKPKT